MWTDEILRRLEHPISREILHCFPSLPSTNNTAKEMAAKGAPAGTTVIADTQTAGRGRMGRSFHSPAGCGIYLSRILRPGCRPTELMHLTCAVAVTVCDTIEKLYGFRPGIKWVNDLIAQQKKLGGILTEMALGADGTVSYCVVGIGINCGYTPMPEELSSIAVSLEEVLGHPVDRDSVIAALMDALGVLEQRITDKAYWIRRYREDCITLGCQIRVLAQPPYSAKALDVDENGALVLSLPDDTHRILAAGEVSIRTAE